MGKKNKKKEQHDTTAQTRKTLKEILENVKEYKEAYTLLWLVISFVLTTIWSICCNMGYKGYADHWGISSQYMYKDNFNILTSFILSLGIACVILLIIYEIAKKTASSKWARFFTIAIAVFVLVLPFVAFALLFLNTQMFGWIGDFIKALIGIAALAVFFLAFYIPMSILILEVNKSGNNSNGQTDNDNSVHSSNRLSINITFSTILKSIFIFIPVVLMLFIAVYLYGRIYALSIREFAFIADEFTSLSMLTGEHNVILSETDEYYYLAECTITDEDNGNNNVKKYTLDINPDCYTILKKEEKTNIIKISFYKVV